MNSRQPGDGTDPSRDQNSAQHPDMHQPHRVLDIQRLRSVAEAAAVRRHPVSPRIGRPPKTAFFRTRSSPEFQVETCILEIGEGMQGEPHLVMAQLDDLGPLERVLIPVVLRLATTLGGQAYVWPLRLPSPDRPNRWHLSALRAAELAEHKWLRLVADQAAGEYGIYEALDDLGEPRFPAEPFGETVGRAFAGRVIDTIDHPALRALRGEKL